MARRTAKVLMITGGASGIGAATATLAASSGYRVVICDIDRARGAQIAQAIGPNAEFLELDICSAGQWETVLDAVWSRHGRLDVLINNAAIVHPGYARDVALAEHAATMATNFMGPVTGMLAAARRFKAQGFGHLVTICSMTAFLPYPGIASYAAAKHALRAFHHAMAIEERDSPIAFTIVHPTSTETPMLDKEAQSDAMALAFAGTPVTADFVAAAIMKAVRNRSVEVFMPPERGRVVRRLGTNPRSLLKMVERNEPLGAARLRERRARSKD